MEGVIVQGLLQLLEPEATVRARQRDVGVVQKAVENATRTYNEISGRNVKVSIEASLSNGLCVIQNVSLLGRRSNQDLFVGTGREVLSSSVELVV